VTASPSIRSARAADAPALLAIYRPYVETTAVSFETVVPSTEEFTRRIVSAVDGWSCLLAEIDGKCIGYAYGSTHRARQAYHWSVETSAYVHADHHRQGIARALYAELLAQLQHRGFANAYAGITLPNAASIAFHQSLGFEPIGVFPRVGRKFGSWHDVAWSHRKIRDDIMPDDA
jgi:L-amino acid N-acyltransferase YncA